MKGMKYTIEKIRGRNMLFRHGEEHSPADNAHVEFWYTIEEQEEFIESLERLALKLETERDKWKEKKDSAEFTIKELRRQLEGVSDGNKKSNESESTESNKEENLH